MVQIPALLLTLVAPVLLLAEPPKYTPQVVPGQAAPAASSTPPAAPPAAATPSQPGGPKIYPGLIQQPVPQKPPQKPGNAANPAGDMMSRFLQAMTDQNRGDAIPDDTDWSTYEFKDDFNFYYGGKGAGNIGNGLCTSKNVNRTQVKNGYCAILADALEREGTCAKEQLDILIQRGSRVGDIKQYCPTFDQLGAFQQRMMYQQLLASLITLESGWNTKAVEPGWRTPSGELRQGKGLFQVGNWDTKQGPDCAGVGGYGIFDAATNMKCGACIALQNIVKDNTIGHGKTDKPCEQGGSCGMARYFGPMRDGQSSKRNAMKGAVSEYCRSNVNGGSGATPVTSGGPNRQQEAKAQK